MSKGKNDNCIQHHNFTYNVPKIKDRDFSIMSSNSNTRIGRMLEKIFSDLPENIAVRLWQGETLNFGSGTPEATLIFHDQRLFRDLALFRNPLRLAEGYFQGKIDVEGDLYKALGLKQYLQTICLSAFEKTSLLYAVLFPGSASTTNSSPTTIQLRQSQRLWGNHSKEFNKKAIAFHYDVSNAFYGLWLDEKMVYSCAYFESKDESLDQAQNNKLSHICRKLQLTQGDRLLDIGCGWGALIIWAAQHYNIKTHGITLSRQQYEHCIKIIQQNGLQDRVSVELIDYRDLQGESQYDKIVSVGMFEHVGIKNLPRYFATVKRLLKPGGLFLNHGITQDQVSWKKTVGRKFINQYVFPDGELDTVSNVQSTMERAGFEIHDVESLREHYALTLRYWVSRLENHKEESLNHVCESTYRVWHLYMAACALQFEQGEMGVYQILSAKRDGELVKTPLTRRNLYQ